MATVSFHVRTTTVPSQIHIRFIHGRNIDLWAGTNLLIDPEHWNKSKQNVRAVKDAHNANFINSKLDGLKSSVIDGFTLSYANGDIIDSTWLKKLVLNYFGRPEYEINSTRDKTVIYLCDFMDWWIREVAPTYRNERSKKRLTEKAIGFYELYLSRLLEYEEWSGSKIRLSELNTKKADDIMFYFEETLNYAPSVIMRFCTTYNFFCERAIENERNLPRKYKCFYEPNSKKEVLEPYLNEDEILSIFKHDFSYDKRLDNARDNFIIGLNTGLRISDFLQRLKIDNIKDGFIEIKTAKTDTLVSLPIHWMVKDTLNKRGGDLPEKISDGEFNVCVKEICKAVGIDKETQGYLFDAKTKRKKLGVYPKYMLVSSHICRRSFATNNFDRISNDDLMRLGGWSSQDMMMRYVRKTSRDSAKRLKEIWERMRAKSLVSQ